MAPPTYPPPPRGDEPDDPFRPLEDPDDPETVRFVEAQNALTEEYLRRAHTREAIRTRITELWDYPKRGVPFERGGRWFQMRNTGLQAQSVLWVGSGPGDEGRVLIDPNAFSDDGTVSLTGLGVSDGGDLVAYATSTGGSDFLTWRVRKVDTGEDLPDTVEWSKFSGAAWAPDSTGFYYGAVARPEPGHELRQEVSSSRIMFHRLGTQSEDDVLVFEAPEHPDWLPSADVTDDGRYLVVTIQRGTGTETRVVVRDLSAGGNWTVLEPGFDSKAVVIGNDGPRFFILSDRDAERGRVIQIEVGADPEAREVVAQVPDTLVEAKVCGRRLVCHYLHHAHSVLRVYGLDGVWSHEVDLPGMVSLVADPLTGASISGRPDAREIYFQIISFVESGSLWSHDVESGQTSRLRPSAAAIDAEAFLTEQVFIQSGDGTQVPMFITRRRELDPDGDRPVLLYGYGGFDIPITPSFSVTFAAWLDRGGVLAVANLRGGGEYGREWHEAGRLARKQNVFDDFAACARWLGGESGWSRAGRVAIWGGSNGGLLVGASVVQRPELFGAAIADVGVFDMLRFHLWTIGWAWKSDYGDPEDDEARAWLRAYSPLHNVESGRCYPPIMLLTGDHDDRVVPAHSYKFAATLQEAQACDHPVLLRVETSAGHGLGKPTNKLIAEATDRLAFLDVALSGTGPSA